MWHLKVGFKSVFFPLDFLPQMEYNKKRLENANCFRCDLDFSCDLPVPEYNVTHRECGDCCGFPVVKASFLTEEAVNTDSLKMAIDAAGYICPGVESVPYEKKGLFERR